MTDDSFDPYRTLGLSSSASPEEVKSAYREAAKRLHPDRSPGKGSRERFGQVVEAYHILSDPERRAAWDRQHSEAPKADSEAAFRKDSQGEAGVLQGLTRVVGDVLEQVKGGVERRWSLGRDLRYTVSLTFREAICGCAKEIAFDAPARCGACEGLGRGRRDGDARVVCGACQGEGVVVAERRFVLEIPPGSSQGQLTRIPKGGIPGARGGPEGDLTFILEVTPHPLLNRQGDALECLVPLPATKALTGGALRVPTLEGPRTITVPPGVQTGQVFRLPGRGVPGPEGTRGDLKITLEVESPAVMPEDLRRLLEEAERQDPSTVFPRSTAFRRQMEDTHPGEVGDG